MADGEMAVTPPAKRVKPFNPYIFGFKALGIATVIVGVTATCLVGVTTWYWDIHNVHPYLCRLC
jgi:hypothetical protein